MKASELRIDNLVFDIHETLSKIKCIDTTHGIGYLCYWNSGALYEENEIDISEFTPIPLTEEWLVRLGFEMFGDDTGGHIDINYSIELQIDISKNESTFSSIYDTIEGPEIKYVHQLQNLYFALVQKELTIKEDG